MGQLEVCRSAQLRLREQLVILHSEHAGSAKNTLSILACCLFCFVFRLRCWGKKQYLGAVPCYPAFKMPVDPLGLLPQKADPSTREAANIQESGWK